MIKKIKVHQSNNLNYMSEEKNVIEPEKFANSWVIFSSSFLVLLLILWFTTKDSFWTGMIAFSISSILVIGYCIYSNFKTKKIEVK